MDLAGQDTDVWSQSQNPQFLKPFQQQRLQKSASHIAPWPSLTHSAFVRVLATEPHGF